MPESNLPRSTPEALGISSKALLSYVNEMDTCGQEQHSFILLRHGKVAAEGWWAPHTPDEQHIMNSLSKSFTSTGVGIAVGEGLLRVEDKVISFFPGDLPEQVSDHLAMLTVRDLLTMSVGQEKEIWPQDSIQNWVRSFLNNQPIHKPGTVFMYNTMATYMLSAIVQKVSGLKLLDYLTPRLFDPLGISGMIWQESPQGINTGGFGLYIKTEDIAKFGQLYLQKGVWQGKRILSADWIETATSKLIDSGEYPGNDWKSGYGYQFWRTHNGFYRADGAQGQFCVVMEKYDAVLAVTANARKMESALNIAWKYLLPAFSEEILPDDPESHTELLARIAGLKIDPA